MPTLDLHDDIQRVCDVGLDGAVWDLDAALQYAGFEARNSLCRRIGKNSGSSSGVPRVEELQEVEGLFSANFALDDAVGSVAERRP